MQSTKTNSRRISIGVGRGSLNCKFKTFGFWDTLKYTHTVQLPYTLPYLTLSLLQTKLIFVCFGFKLTSRGLRPPFYRSRRAQPPPPPRVRLCCKDNFFQYSSNQFSIKAKWQNGKFQTVNCHNFFYFNAIQTFLWFS